MPIEPFTESVLGFLAREPEQDSSTLSIKDIRINNNRMEFEFDLKETQMHRERSVDVDGPNGQVPIRIYYPRALEKYESLPILMFMHGGGWALCDMDTHENMLRYICKSADVIAVNIGYRLAPENKFPAGIEDCYAVLEWLERQASSIGGIAEKISIAGDSAGGNIAAVLALMSRDRKGPRIASQVLIYPSVAMGVLPRYASWKKYCTGDYLLSEEGIDQMMGWYLNAEEELTDFRVSPILAEDHKDLPIALIITAQYDPLCDEGAHYAEKLRIVGVEVDYKCYEGTIHAFMSLAGGIPLGYTALDYVVNFLSSVNH